ncbi:MAG: hypothetical protein KDC71_02245 [Acidobacteria bacterium]|nr:hypothetical protein [Acidobacteriota bacterium]
MNAALRYLWIRSQVGRFKNRLQRLKNPKYLFGAVLGTLYLFFFVYRRLGRTGHLQDMQGFLAHLVGYGCLILMGFFGLQWCMLFRSGGLRLTENELDLLLSAPLRRRDLLHYHLLKPQFSLLTTALILSLAFHRLMAGQGFLMPIVLLYLVFNLLLFMQTFLDLLVLWPERSAKLRIVLFLLGLVWVAAGVAGYFNLTEGHLGKFDWRDAFPYLQVVLPIAWPFQKIAIGFFQGGLLSFSLSAGLLLTLIALLYAGAWALEIDPTRLEQKTLTRHQRRQKRIRRRTGGRRDISADQPRSSLAGWLGLGGSPTRVLMGKSLIGLRRYLSQMPLTYMVPAFCCFYAFGLLAAPAEGKSPLIFGCLFFAGILIVIGGKVLHLDFRTELVHLELLRSFPMVGRQMVMAMLCVNALVLGAVQLFLCILFWFGLLTTGQDLGQFSPFAIGLASILVLPVVSALFFLMENLLVLWLPGWFMEEEGEMNTRGFDAMGKRALNLIVRFVGFLGLSLIPALFGGLLYFLIGGNVGLLAGAFTFSIFLAGEMVPVIFIAGNLYDRIESFGDEAL